MIDRKLRHRIKHYHDVREIIMTWHSREITAVGFGELALGQLHPEVQDAVKTYN